MIISSITVAKLIENSILLLTFIGVCVKMKTITGRRDALLNAFELLLNSNKYQMKCEETKKFDIEGEKKSRCYAQSYTILVALSLTSVIRSALMNISARILPFNGWFPFKHADTIGFFIVFSYQIITVIYFSTIGSFADTVICGGMIHCSNHLKILKYSFENIPNNIKKHSTEPHNYHKLEHIFIKNCIKYHLLIFELSFFIPHPKKKGLESSLKSTCVKTIDILANNQNLGLDTSGKST
ncbi:hypothetical protein PV328_008639 [Microctonus aethiopoides]|uniref:Uncharacterized protein n=1 Tax=Microctonus aethiopoides TaxID=144406 RepID=A0AA39FJN9_9HYME|nr:hypothetical protein PV328_008639 [Microctonus aethiopoides]